MTAWTDPGRYVYANGYEGVVIREYMPDIFEVRLPGGDVVLPRREMRPLVECADRGCRIRFFPVPARGERAPFCLDHADARFGKR